MDASRAWVEIDLNALAANLEVVRERAGAGTRVMLVVKQDAYGHGAVTVARHAARCGVGAFGVGTSSEALELREAGIQAPILVLGTVVEEELLDCLRHDVHIGLHSTDRARSLARLARRQGLRARVHLNVDTGMGRLGVPAEEALRVLAAVRAEEGLELAGIMSHLAPTEGLLDPFAAEQVARFEQVLDGAREGQLLSGWVHMANSAGLFTGLGRGEGVDRFDVLDTVRPGIAAYGALPGHLPGAACLSPVLSLRSQVVFLKDVRQGTPVGYGSTWRAPVDTRIATVAIGYGHGLPWGLSDGQVLLRGRRAPIVGRLSMDYATVDVGHLPGVEVGDVATLVGTDGDAAIGLGELASAAGTVPYEIACALGRLPRRRVGGQEVNLPAHPPTRAPQRGPLPAPSSEPSPHAGQPRDIARS